MTDSHAYVFELNKSKLTFKTVIRIIISILWSNACWSTALRAFHLETCLMWVLGIIEISSFN